MFLKSTLAIFYIARVFSVIQYGLNGSHHGLNGSHHQIKMLNCHVVDSWT